MQHKQETLLDPQLAANIINKLNKNERKGGHTFPSASKSPVGAVTKRKFSALSTSFCTSGGV
jgi:hypothetical protein